MTQSHYPIYNFAGISPRACTSHSNVYPPTSINLQYPTPDDSKSHLALSIIPSSLQALESTVAIDQFRERKLVGDFPQALYDTDIHTTSCEASRSPAAHNWHEARRWLHVSVRKSKSSRGSASATLRARGLHRGSVCVCVFSLRELLLLTYFAGFSRTNGARQRRSCRYNWRMCGLY